MWFIEQPGGTYKNGVVGRVTPAGAITEMSTGLVSGLQPTGITTGADGNLWVTDSGGPGTTIVRLTPGGAATDFTPASLNGLQASDPVAGADGNVWFLLAGGSVGNTGAIGRVTTGGTVTLFSAGLTNNGHLSGLASGPDGNLWFAQSDGGAGGVGFITPAGAITELPHAAFGGTQPVDLVTAADGAVYVTEAAGHGAVVRVTSDGTVTPAVANSAGTPGAITAQPGGDVWIAETGHNNIGRLVITPLLPTGAGGPTGATGTTGSTGGDGSAPAGPNGVAPVQRPVLGVRAVAQPHGLIFVRREPKGPLVKLSTAANIPIGSVVVARTGTVRLVLALPAGKTQAVSVGRGTFVLRQPKALHGMTDLVLAGGNLSACRRGATIARVGHRAKAKRSRVIRSLWAKDHHGKFQTFGNNSVATVRGTEWVTEERCDGTLTKVLEGVVSVRDRHTGRTVTVTAGHSFLAKRGR